MVRISHRLRIDSRRQRARSAALALVLAAALPMLGVGAFLVGAQEATPPAAACPTGTPAATATTAASGTPAAEHCVTIDLHDIYFEPNLITLPADTPVRIVLTNRGAIVHNFSVTDHGNQGLENLNISVTLQPGETETVTFDAPAGLYYFFCDEPGHEAAGMRGYLDVKEGAAIDTAEATVTPRAG